MDSVCPKCKKNITHEDFLFEVQCTCGSRFNPFMGLEGTAQPQEEIAHAPEPAPEPKVEKIEEFGMEDFKESTNAFKEIQDFGEKMPPPGPPAKAGSSSAPAADSLESAGMGLPDYGGGSSSGGTSHMTASDGNFLFTSAPSLDGYTVEAHLLPVSAQANIESSAQDPLRDAFLLLKKRAQDQGANAIVSFQWKVAPDGNRVFVSGLPLKVRR